MAEAAVLMPQSGLPALQPLSLNAELAQYDRILSLRDDILSGKHPRIKLPLQLQEDGGTALSQDQLTLPNGTAVPQEVNANVVANSSSNNNESQPSQAKPPSPQHYSGLNPIFLQESEVVIKAKMKLERQRIERAIGEHIRQKDAASKKRMPDKDILPEFDISEVFFQAQELVKPIEPAEVNTANRQISSSDTIDDNTYYSSQATESANEDSDSHPKRRATKPCRFYFEGSCRKGANCRFSHDAAFKQKLQAPANADYSERDSAPNSRVANRGFTAKGGRIRDSPTYDSRESGELIEDPPYSPALPMPAEDRSPNRTRNEANLHGPRPQEDSRQRRRPSPPNREGRIVRNHITSPAAPQPSRVSPLAVAKVPRVDRARHDTGEPSPRQARQPPSGQRTPIVATPPKSRKRRRDLDASETTRNVAPRRQAESPAPYIKEEPVSPPPLSALPPSRMVQRDEARHPMEMGPPSPRYGERVVYQPVQEDYAYTNGSGLRRVSSPSVRRVVSGPALHQEAHREPDLRRVVSTRYIERPLSPRGDLVSVSGQPRSARAMSHAAAPPEDPPQIVYRASVQPQRPVYVSEEQPASPIVRYSRQPAQEPDLVPMGPPLRRIIVDEHGNRYYEAPMPDRRASAVPEPRYAPESHRSIEQYPSGRASVRPETARAYQDGRYPERWASPQPPSPQYVQYHASVQPSQPRTYYEPDSNPFRNRNEVVRIVEAPQERRLERAEDYQRGGENIARIPSVRPADVHYDGPGERFQRVHTVQPEQQRYVDVPRNGPMYVREVREVSVRPDDRYAVQEFADAGRQRYRYVSTSHGAGPGPRTVEGDVIMRQFSAV